MLFIQRRLKTIILACREWCLIYIKEKDLNRQNSLKEIGEVQKEATDLDQMGLSR